MPSMSDDFQLPIMYQDLRDPALGFLPNIGMYPGMGTYPPGYCTNYLGGMRMPKEIQSDTLVLKNKKKNKLSDFAKAMLALSTLVGLVYFRNKGAFKWIANQAKKGKNWFQDLFKKKSPLTPPVSPEAAQPKKMLALPPP